MTDLFMCNMCETSHTRSMWQHLKLRPLALFLIEDLYKNLYNI